MTKSGMISTGTVAQNRKARHDYKIDDTFEAGLMLLGTEVKSLRLGRGNIQDSYASAEDGGMYLINAYIPEYEGARHFGHEPRRKRKLLMKKREIEKLNKKLIYDICPISLTVCLLELVWIERMGINTNTHQYRLFFRK
jgi:SsrA-binding protein